LTVPLSSHTIYVNKKSDDGMNKKKTAGIVVASIVGTIVVITAVALCVDFTPPPNESPRPTVDVDYEVIALYGTGYLSVRVEGPQKSYEVLLFDPEGESVGWGFISSDNMLTGHETVEVSMTGTGVTNPISGEYWLIVKESWTDKTVFEAKPVFAGPDISITSVEFETSYYDYIGGYIDEVIAQVHNGGDLPIQADEMTILVAGEQEDSIIYELLPHGETTVIEDWVVISGLGKGTYPVTVEIYSEGVKLASYATQVGIW